MIATVPYHGFSLRLRAVYKVKPQTAACETCTDKRTAVIAMTHNKSKSKKPFEHSNSWSASWLHRPGFYMSSVALCHSLWARPPPVWTDLPEWLTNWSTSLVLVESLADWLVASDACFPACLPVKCKPNGPLAGWAGCDIEPHHWGLDRKPVVGGCSPLTLLVSQTLLWNTHWKTQPSSAVGYIFASSDG